MKKIHIKYLKWVKSPIDCEDFRMGEIKLVGEVWTNKDQVVVFMGRGRNKPILVKGVHNHNCSFLDCRHQWIPCDSEGNEVELTVC